ncbi:hypothetical protein C8Q80DRAFT_1266666 [Daedaleopsis nitida]|nr:hypothetical protein C8Q80DRAFT_1266666 [Daedaleopsis nitida]
MATVTHYIYSHYEKPKLKEDEEILQERTEEDERDPWLTESTFGVNRRLKNPPRFVPAIVSYDEVNNMIGGASSSIPRVEESSSSRGVSSWYRSLPRAPSTPTIGPQATPPLSSIVSSPAPADTDSPPIVTASASSTLSEALPAPQPRRKNNWFTSQAMISEPSSSRSTPTLADILAREPPPERQDQPFVPPVFLHIGPSNRGFSLLQKSGWSEGEALGASAPRRSLTQKALEKRPLRTILDDRELAVQMEEREISMGDDDEVCEVRRVEVVDLTLSDSEEEDVELTSPLASSSEPSAGTSSHNPTALLTPIATVLKSDRLGIGLKAKTVGPHKESKKRVTHNQAALAAHVRANEELRMRKALVGRGARSFARIAKAEAESRKRLLASLNVD